MAQISKLYFLIKLAPKKPPNAVKPLTTVIWRAKVAVGGSELHVDIDLSDSLQSAGPMKDVEWDVFPVQGDRKDAEALLHNDSFSWKDDALAISIHSISVGVMKPGEPHPFGVPKFEAK